MSEKQNQISNSIIGIHYKVVKRIGEGSFGVIYQGINLTNNQFVAIKFEHRKSDAPQLRDEYRTYKLLQGCEGIANCYYFGQEGVHNVLVMDLLGPSLEDLFDMCNRQFTIQTTAVLATQMLKRIELLHNKHLIYRDIKPDNFLIGRPGGSSQHIIFLLDFGMCKHFRDPRTKQHIPYRERKSLSGTARYMSIHTHLGREQSRRDDIEALGHVFVYFLRGSLPWQGLKAATNRQKYEKIGEKKQSVTISELCANLPKELSEYMTYARRLAFEEDPDYPYLTKLFETMAKNANPGSTISTGTQNSGFSKETKLNDYDWVRLQQFKELQQATPHVEKAIEEEKISDIRRSWWRCCF